MPLDGDVGVWERPLVAPPAPAKPDVFSVRAFRDWLATMDPAQWYNPGSLNNCAIGQYVRSLGGSRRGFYYLACGQQTDIINTDLARIAYGDWRHTFGAALACAEAFLREQGE